MDIQDKQNGKRTYPLRMPPNWQPPYPSFESELGENCEEVTMMIAGCQFQPQDIKVAYSFIEGLAYLMKSEGQCNHVDLSLCKKDSAGYMQYIATGYWLESKQFLSFSEDCIKLHCYWTTHTSHRMPYGIFREIFNVPKSRFETLHSGADHLVGVAHIREDVSEPISTHAYWGSMRDRIPDSAYELFEGNSAERQILYQDHHRIVIQPNVNMALIRSGQDLRHAVGRERNEYYADVQPVLIAGMDFLRDEGGKTVNCYDCRFMHLLDDDGNETEHTYGLAYFASLSDLENWSEHHPTHLAIFNAFLEYAPKFGAEMKSRYWHEVSVLPETGQYGEYINCKPGTGFLSTI